VYDHIIRFTLNPVTWSGLNVLSPSPSDSSIVVVPGVDLSHDRRCLRDFPAIGGVHLRDFPAIGGVHLNANKAMIGIGLRR